jgi:acetyl-CoA carboxylase carboxyltransferase component
MISAITDANVPKICVIVRKAYGAGLYAMSGPAFDPIATLALPTAKIAVMGPEPAVNAVFANRIAAIADPAERAAFVADRRAEYEADVDLLRLASELVVDAIVPFEALRDEIVHRFAAADPTDREPSPSVTEFLLYEVLACRGVTPARSSGHHRR